MEEHGPQFGLASTQAAAAPWVEQPCAIYRSVYRVMMQHVWCAACHSSMCSCECAGAGGRQVLGSSRQSDMSEVVVGSSHAATIATLISQSCKVATREDQWLSGPINAIQSQGQSSNSPSSLISQQLKHPSPTVTAVTAAAAAARRAVTF